MHDKGLISSLRSGLIASLAAAILVLPTVHSAHALTEPKKPLTTQQLKDGTQPGDDGSTPDVNGDDTQGDNTDGLPMPDSLTQKPTQSADPDKKDTTGEKAGPPAEIILDNAKLPEAVQKMRVAMVEAAASGDIERLRALMGTGADQTQIAIGDAPDDPIAALKSLSGDPEGREVLAIMLDILSTGAALVDKGTPNEMYVWPYFAEKKLDSLSPPEMVELFRIVTAADVNDMKEYGGYNFYRIGISRDGKWKLFTAGD